MNITEQAKEKFLKEIDPSNTVIFIDLKLSGCNGYSYQIKTLAKQDIAPDMLSVDFDELSLVYRNEHKEILENLSIDFTKEGFNQKFNFSNPAEKGQCGCGASFRV